MPSRASRSAAFATAFTPRRIFSVSSSRLPRPSQPRPQVPGRAVAASSAACALLRAPVSFRWEALYSPAQRDALTAEILEVALSDPELAYLASPRFADILQSWA